MIEDKSNSIIMKAKYEILNDEELRTFNGGIGLVTAGLIIVGGVFLAGTVNGCTDQAKK